MNGLLDGDFSILVATQDVTELQWNRVRHIFSIVSLLICLLVNTVILGYVSNVTTIQIGMSQCTQHQKYDMVYIFN